MNPTDGMLAAMKPDESVEVRLSHDYVYAGWRTPTGLIEHSLTKRGVGTPYSLVNLQMKMIVPQKAVEGWQYEVVEALRSGLYEVLEVR